MDYLVLDYLATLHDWIKAKTKQIECAVYKTVLNQESLAIKGHTWASFCY